MNGDVVVNLRGGAYTLAQTWSFDPRDSGTGGFQVVYQAYGGETPVLSGGRVIDGWTPLPGSPVWYASVGQALQVRQLYVNGARATRARGDPSVLGTLTKTPSGYVASNGGVASWGNAGDVEFVYRGFPSAGASWSESRCGVTQIVGAAGTASIEMKQPCWTNATVNKCCGQTVNLPTQVENAYELLDQPGEWYFDKTSTVFYYAPRPGEDMTTARVVAPTTEILVSGAGTIATPLQNVQFVGLTFAYATWLRPSGPDGFVEIQANYGLVGDPAREESLPGNVAFHTVRNLRFERNLFVHLGAGGFVLDQGSQDNVVIGNLFKDISGTAVRIGDVTAPDAAGPAQDTGNWVVNNRIDGAAVEFHGGVGILAGYLSDTRLLHNEVGNVPYTAISLGWGWGTPSYARSNEVAYNEIHDHMLELSDGGGIYTLSPQGDSSYWSSVHDNYIRNQPNNYGALYFDEGSANMVAYRNVVANVPYWVFVWTSSIHDLLIHDNFSNVATYRNEGTSVFIYDNRIGSPWSADALDVINGAGLEAGYQDLKTAAIPDI